MLAIIRSRRVLVPALVVVTLLLVAIGLGPRLGFTAAPGAVWTEQPPGVAPAVAQGPWVELARRLKPAVVNISTRRTQESAATPFGDDERAREFFRRFFGEDPRGMQPRRRTVRSLGSGFLINARGDIITNNHVVDGATEITVRLSDGRELPAKLVGRDPKTDLALIRIEATGLPVIPLGDSTALQVGEPVMAIGNPFGLEQTVTTGIVSATGRVIGEGPYDEFIQTDASINPGNSGGPLINTRGEAIGINAAIFSQSGGSIGIGFAIPVSAAKTVVSQLATTGHVVRGWLGVSIQPLTADLAKGLQAAGAHGALVASVAPNSPAERAGLKTGDVITEYDGRPVARAEDLPRAVATTPVGRAVPVGVLREGKPLSLTATVGRLAESEETRKAEPARTGSLGLTVAPLGPDEARERGVTGPGVLVRSVEDGSPADTAGIQAGDVITEVDRRPVKDVEGLRHALAQHPKGAPALLLVHRDGGSRYVAIAS